MSKQKQKYIKGGLLAVFVILFIVATFCDLAISNAIINENSLFGKIMEDITTIPFAYALLLSGCIAFGTCKKEKSVKAIAILILCAIYYLFLVAVSAIFLYGYLPVWALVLHLGGIIALTIFAFKIKEEEKKDWQKIALVSGLSIIISLVTIEYLKVIWGRVRPRALEGRTDIFTSWYSINGKRFLEDVVRSEEIKSFPSGHSQWGAGVIIFSLIPRASKKLQDKEFMIWCLCILWGALTMLSRVIVGAHFVTDAMAGFTIIVTLFMIFRRLVFGKNTSN